MKRTKEAMVDYLLSLNGVITHTTDMERVKPILIFWGINKDVTAMWKHINENGVISVFIETDSEITAIARSI